MKLEGDQNVNEEINILFNSHFYEKDINKILFFFENFYNNNGEKIDFEKTLKLKLNNYKNISNKNPTEITNILNELKEKKIYDYRKDNNKNNYIKMFENLYDKKQAIDFLLSNSTNDIKLLYDKIEPNYRTLSMQDITDTLNCVGFFQELKEKKKFL